MTQTHAGQPPTPIPGQLKGIKQTPPRRGRAPVGDGEDRIRLTEAGRNHKKGGRSKQRYELYKDNMTINAYISGCEKLGFPASKARADLRWDLGKKLITIESAKRS